MAAPAPAAPALAPGAPSRPEPRTPTPARAPALPAAEGARGEGGRAGAAYPVVPKRPRSQVHVRPAGGPRSGGARPREAAAPGHSRARPAAPPAPRPRDPNFPRSHGAGSFRASRARGWVSAATPELGNKGGARAGRGEQRKTPGGDGPARRHPGNLKAHQKPRACFVLRGKQPPHSGRAVSRCIVPSRGTFLRNKHGRRLFSFLPRSGLVSCAAPAKQLKFCEGVPGVTFQEDIRGNLAVLSRSLDPSPWPATTGRKEKR
ncbi:uncharacterized protein RBU33_024161 isoform 1-T1 [Hipposideros larvatus]